MVSQKYHAGDRNGRLTIIAPCEDYISPSGKKHHVWQCVCDCGNHLTVLADNFPRTKSCGCLKREQASKIGSANLKHGDACAQSRTRLYRIWSGIKARCYNQNNEEHFARYGARGITMCKEWRNSYEAFKKWALSNGYRDDLSIDRVNNDGNYEPSNCRWTTNKVQQNNLSTNRTITLNGKRFTIAQIADRYSVPHYSLLHRLNSGWSGEDIVSFAKNYSTAQKQEVI